mmetsp:Transcript_22918/g.53468  ORF Transcript_22918/g.53468 Transcript_22918/m.53468 type:complete len:215 (+) Transcript_22918:77-721(+)|eukprot:CAMPEP_0114545516 /NCGR_PEP_ID=MMETSP0114-20121206/3444_1 /TAXON_ID=31324 /ORGANISM="Goniomonas sp, Strain m" /LENGTH=214 /DNA_ID=CAMNT_0001729953 /DNA_START=63 /DNA_END=707 /DNA_ORIENTATION=+
MSQGLPAFLDAGFDEELEGQSKDLIGSRSTSRNEGSTHGFLPRKAHSNYAELEEEDDLEARQGDGDSGGEDDDGRDSGVRGLVKVSDFTEKKKRNYVVPVLGVCLIMALICIGWICYSWWETDASSQGVTDRLIVMTVIPLGVLVAISLALNTMLVCLVRRRLKVIETETMYRNMIFAADGRFDKRGPKINLQVQTKPLVTDLGEEGADETSLA